MAAGPRAAFVLGCALAVGGCAPPSPPPAPIAGGPGSLAPELTVGGDGRAYLSWLEPDGAGHALRFAVFDAGGAGWSAPRTVARGDDWFVNWADFPSVTALGDGTLAAHWLQRSGESTYAYDVRMAFSADGGATWGASFVLHEDGTRTEHGFVTLAPEGRDRLHAVWLDGRQFEGLDEATGEQVAAMTVRHALLDAAGQVIAREVIDERACTCCQTSAAPVPGGLLVAWRDRDAGEVRDTAWRIRAPDGGWGETRMLAPDGWVIDACPVNGPSLAARAATVAAVTFTAARGMPRVDLRISRDGGGAFGEAVRIDDGQPLGRADVVLLPDGAALVAWLEQVGAVTELRLRRVSAAGRAGPARTLERLAAGRASGFPRMVATGGRVLVAWTAGDGPSRHVQARALGPADLP